MLMERILYETGASQQSTFISGEENFRYKVNPQYKAQRKDKPKPRWLQDVREHLIVGWGARIADGIEADDELGISQCSTEDDTVICTIDKDLLQIPGQHFNFVSGEHRIISPHQGLQNFYFQMIMGDTSDNIFGFDGIARSRVPKFLEPTIALLMECSTEREMHEFVYDLYETHARVDQYKMNADCLYIMKSYGDKWKPPTQSLSSEAI